MCLPILSKCKVLKGSTLSIASGVKVVQQNASTTINILFLVDAGDSQNQVTHSYSFLFHCVLTAVADFAFSVLYTA